MNYVADAAEFYDQNSHPSRSSAAEIHKLELRLGNSLSGLVLPEHAFEHRAFVAKVGCGIDTTLEKFSSKTVRHAANTHRCKGEVVALDVERLEAKCLAIVDLDSGWRKSTKPFGVQIYAAEIRKSVAVVADDPEGAVRIEAGVLLRMNGNACRKNAQAEQEYCFTH